MFNMYRRRFYRGPGNRGNRDGGGSSEELGHDRFNYMNPNVNYDKWPRRLRPKKNSVTIELEAPESPHPSEDKAYGSELRDCKGSLREHQRLLNLRSVRHKCSPSCQVKVNTRASIDCQNDLVYLSFMSTVGSLQVDTRRSSVLSLPLFLRFQSVILLATFFPPFFRSLFKARENLLGFWKTFMDYLWIFWVC